MPFLLQSLLTSQDTGPSSLLTGLVAYWTLNEASGSRADSGTNGFTLTDNGSTPSGTGKIGNGASMNGSTQFLTRAHNAALSFANTDFTIGTWFNQSSTAGVQAIVGKGGAVGTQQDYLLYINAGNANFHTYNGNEGTWRANPQVAVSAGWNYLLAWQDVTANALVLQINNGTPVSVVRNGVATSSSSTFSLGMGFASTYFLIGTQDEIGIWNRLLTAGERTALWYGGAGLTHPF